MSDCSDYLPCIIFIIILLFQIMHFVFFFFMKETDFNTIFDTLDSSPIFNLRIAHTCNQDEHIVFQYWKGKDRAKEYYLYDATKPKIEGKTEIAKINGYYFCYEVKKSYKELLYSGQIISKSQKCPFGYKNCGTIDTLEQELCIPENDNCPLYDAGIGKENGIYKNNIYYKFHGESKIYYNNKNYDELDKKIIGKLILNDGLPCYDINEKLWKKFSDDEVEDTHLKCNLEIFGKSNDDRYKEIGEISYFQLYQDNLGDYFSLFDNKRVELKSNFVSLYKREFLGINKECDEKSNLSEDSYKKLKKSQKSIKLLLIIEPIIMFLSIFSLIVGACLGNCDNVFICVFIFIGLLILSSLVCYVVFLLRIIRNDLSYDCSDKITNELFKIQNDNTKITILYSLINLGADLLSSILIILSLFVLLCIDCCKDCCSSCKDCLKDCCYYCKRRCENCCHSCEICCDKCRQNCKKSGKSSQKTNNKTKKNEINSLKNINVSETVILDRNFIQNDINLVSNKKSGVVKDNNKLKNIFENKISYKNQINDNKIDKNWVDGNNNAINKNYSINNNSKNVVGPAPLPCQG